MFTTIMVNAGSCAPKPSNILWNTGTTFNNKITVTIIATTITLIGYFIAFLIFCFSCSLFSLYSATRSSMVSKAPDCSPDSTKLQNSSSKYKGYLRSAVVKLPPPSTSALIPMTTSRIARLSNPSATISNDCTSGTPAFIIVAN